MRNLTVLSLITILFFPIMATKAEAQCLLCGVVGYALGSASSDEQAGASAGRNVIYTAPHIGKRISDPLDVRIASSSRMGFSNIDWTRKVTKAQNMSLWEIFKATIPNHENFTILEISRVIEPANSRIAVFWFAYIENEKMKPLSGLTAE